MALTFFRWLALTVAGALIATVAIMREGRVEGWRRVPGATTYEQRDRARGHLAQAATRTRLLELRDSVVRAVGRAKTRQDRMIVSPAISEYRILLEGIFTVAMAGRQGGAVPVDLVAIHDSGDSIPGAPGIGIAGGTQVSYFLPDAHTGDRCLVLLRYNPPAQSTVQRRIAARRMANQMRRGRLIGPCAFYSEFGVPGPQVRRWLDRHEWSIARSASWGRAPEMWRDVSTPTALHLLFNPEWDSRLRAVTSPEGFRCATGDRSECQRVLVEGFPARSMLLRFGSAWGNVVDLGGWWSRAWFRGYSGFGPLEETLLAEMVRTLGPERFKAFWQSSADPATAFRSAAGEDLGSWMVDWAGRVYGPMNRGPAIEASVAPWILGFVALALLGAMRTAHSRRVR